MAGRQRKRRGGGQNPDVAAAREASAISHRRGSLLPTARVAAAGAVLVAVTVLVMFPVLGGAFTNWDDDVNVTGNPFLRPPLGAGLAHLWTHAYRNLYVPLVYTSFALDKVLGGGSAFAFHLTNLVLHAMSVLVVFAILRRVVLGADGRGLPDRGYSLFALVAGSLVFAVHPLQVEAVAWVTGRKDVLSGLLALVAVAAYLGVPEGSVARRLSAPRYRIALGLFALSLLAKPATVTLPLALLGIECLALRRRARAVAAALVPWFVLAAAWSIVTAGAQVVSPELAAAVPLWKRPFVAGWSLGFYAWKLLMPVNLAPVYGHVPWEMFGGARDFLALPAVVVVVAVVLWRSRVSAAALTVFVAFVLPVLGFLPFLYQIYSTVADRYVYLSMLGLAMAMTGMLDGVGVRWPRARPVAVVLAVLALSTWGVLSFRQTLVWRDSETLWLHSVAIAPNVAEAHNNLGSIYAESGRAEPAMRHLEVAIRLKPDYADAHNNIGNLKLDQHRVDEAIGHFRKAIERKPTFDVAWNNLGNAYTEAHRYAEAIDAYRESVRLNPRAAGTRCNLALTYLQAGRAPEAETEARAALALDRGLVNAWTVLGRALAVQGRKTDAAQAFSMAENLKAAGR